MKIIFWCVDTQKDFMLPNGKLYIKGAEEINDNLQKLTDFARDEGIKVVNTADYHTKDSKEISIIPDFQTTFPEHCMVGEEGQDFILQTYPKSFLDNYYIVNYSDNMIDDVKFKRCRNIIILKDAFDVFEGNRNTENVLNLLNPNLIVVYGVAADVCVDFAVRGLLKRKNEFTNYSVIVVVDAIKALDSSPTNLYNLHTNWLMEGAWLVGTEYLKKFIKERV